MHRIGIMQGRLVPPTDGRIQCFPREDWRAEFELAARAELDCIEWIYDLYGADANPIGNDAGLKEMRTLSALHGVRVLSLCADFAMETPLVRANDAQLKDRLEMLIWLMDRCQLLGMNRLVLPFVDAAQISNAEEMDGVCRTLEKALHASERTGVEIHLETSLAPLEFGTLLSKLPHPMLKVNYDSGNSSSLGYMPLEEIAAYGSRIGSVHIKDRIYQGSTVPLGSGDADFGSLFAGLRECGYSGDFILQVARGAIGGEVSWATANRAFVLKCLGQEALT